MIDAPPGVHTMRDMPIPVVLSWRVTHGMASHDERIDGLRRAYDEAHGRFVARLERVAAEALEAVPSEGGWSAAQIAWHVAAVDTAFAGLISGQRPSQPLAADFQERAWSDVVALDSSTTRSVAQCDAPAWCASATKRCWRSRAPPPG